MGIAIMGSLLSTLTVLNRKITILALLLLVATAWRSFKSGSSSPSPQLPMHFHDHRSLRLSDPQTKEYKDLTVEETFVDQAQWAKLGQTPLYTDLHEWKKSLLLRLDRIRLNCGELCAINDKEALDRHKVDGASGSYAQLMVATSCPDLMNDKEIDTIDFTVPYPPPEELKPYYTMHGLVRYIDYRKINSIDSKLTKSEIWTVDYINQYRKKFDHEGVHPAPSFGKDSSLFLNAIRKYTEIVGKRVLVIGSEKPWVEAICIYLGASHVTTIELRTIINRHPQISVMTPAQFRQEWVEGNIDPFDVVVSFSFVEHHGLGRYGDMLNPWGDILTVARAFCVTKQGGYLVLSVPNNPEYEYVKFNDHRVYGRNRMPLLVANWQQIDAEDHDMEQAENEPHRPFVYQKPLP